MIFYGSSISVDIGYEGIISIETNISEKGLPILEISGLVNKSIEESKKRIINSFESIGVPFPLKNISINLSPAELYKNGTHYDLSLAATILKYTNCLTYESKKDLFIGELGYDGSIKGVKNITYLVLVAQRLGFERIFVPAENIKNLEFINHVKLYPVSNLKDLLKLDGLENKPLTPHTEVLYSETYPINFSKVLGNKTNKKILSYALAGNHHLLIKGFPGSGKSLLAKSASDLLPDLPLNQAYEVAKIYSYTGFDRDIQDFNKPPFRSPHNSSSYSSIFGSSGKEVIPGEVCLANNGVLFLDELPEFNRQVIEGLRIPLEDKKITISRSKNKKTFDADFILIATMNPCKCGYFNHKKIECKCLPIEIKRYSNRISGPILDRIDINLDYDGFINTKHGIEYNNYSYKEFLDFKNSISSTRNELFDINNYLSTNYSSTSLFKFVTQKLSNDNARKLIDLLQEKYSISNRKLFKILNLVLTINIFNKSNIFTDESLYEAIYLSGVKL
jgi:magnesium chelatase family protein